MSLKRLAGQGEIRLETKNSQDEKASSRSIKKTQSPVHYSFFFPWIEIDGSVCQLKNIKKLKKFTVFFRECLILYATYYLSILATINFSLILE